MVAVALAGGPRSAVDVVRPIPLRRGMPYNLTIQFIETTRFMLSILDGSYLLDGAFKLFKKEVTLLGLSGFLPSEPLTLLSRWPRVIRC